jgi:hypothetical protein
MIKKYNSCFCVALVALTLGFWSSDPEVEKPAQAVERFVAAFTAGNAQKLTEMILPEILKAKEIKATDVGHFLVRLNSRAARLKSSKVSEVQPKEGDRANQFRAFLVFDVGEVPSEKMGPIQLEMELLFSLSDNQWFLERPLSVNFRITTNRRYPTPAQNEIAMRFSAALEVIDKIRLLGGEDIYVAGVAIKGSALEMLQELEDLHKKEFADKGVHPESRGVSVFVKAGGMENGEFLKKYHGDFPSGPRDHRKPVPWDIFRDYALAALKMGKLQEKRGDIKAAEKIYRRIVGFGKLILDEPGGLQFVNWGLTFEKMGANALAELYSNLKRPAAVEMAEFANMVSRRLNILRTAQDCLDDLAEFRALKASIIAANKRGDTVFRPWAINTLCIFAYKGAPADEAIVKKLGVLALINDRGMQSVAERALRDISSSSKPHVRKFIQRQRQWVRNNQVYGAVSGLEGKDKQ